MESNRTEEKRDEKEPLASKDSEQADQEEASLLLESEDELLVDEEEATALLESGSSAAEGADVANLGDVATEEKQGAAEESTEKSEGNAATKKLKKVSQKKQKVKELPTYPSDKTWLCSFFM